MRAYTVRRDKVHKALLWLKTHNRAYVDIEISTSLLDKLPTNDVPDQFVQNAVSAPPDASDLKEYGPDMAKGDFSNSNERVAADLEVPFVAAVIGTEGAEITAAEEWQQALGTHKRSPNITQRLDPIALWNTASSATEKAARHLAKDADQASSHDIKGQGDSGTACLLQATAVDALKLLTTNRGVQATLEHTIDQDRFRTCNRESASSTPASPTILPVFWPRESSNLVRANLQP
jgi:hypothetical protein